MLLVKKEPEELLLLFIRSIATTLLVDIQPRGRRDATAPRNLSLVGAQRSSLVASVEFIQIYAQMAGKFETDS